MRTLPRVFSQRDVRWADQRLGTVDGTTIGQEGCYITSFAMLAQYYGHDTTPAQLDDMFTDNGWYVDGNLLTDAGLQRAYNDVHYVATYPYQTIPADLNQLKNIMDDLTASVIVEIDRPGDEVHFAPVVGCDGEKVWIANPWSGVVEDFTQDYGDPKKNILKFVVYKGNPVAQPEIPVVGDASSTDPLTACLAMHQTLVEQAKLKDDKIQELGKQLDDIKQTNTDLKASVKEAKDEAAHYLAQLQENAEKDSVAIDEGIRAEAALKDALADHRRIAEELDVPYTLQNVLEAIDALKRIQEQSPATPQPTIWERIVAYFTGKSVK